MFVKSEGGTDQKEENSIVAVCLKCSGRCQTHRNSLMQVAVRKPSKRTSIALWRCEFYAWKSEFYAVYTAKLYTEVYAVYRPDRPTQCVSLSPPPLPSRRPRHHRAPRGNSPDITASLFASRTLTIPLPLLVPLSLPFSLSLVSLCEDRDTKGQVRQRRRSYRLQESLREDS